MKKLKKFLLEIAENKGIFFLKSFLITMVASMAFFVLFFTIIDKSGNVITVGNFDLSRYASEISLGLSIIWGIFFVIMLATYLAIAIKITSFNTNNNLIVLLQTENGREIYTKPLWGKYPYSIIVIPKSWNEAMTVDGEKYFRFPFEFPIDKQIINGCGTETVIIFPITLYLCFNGSLLMRDFKKISSDKNGDILDGETIEIDDYVRHCFLELNSNNKLLEKLKKAAVEYNDGKISQVHLSRIATNEFKFPNKIFSNVRETKILSDLVESRVIAIFAHKVVDRNG